MPPVLIVDDEEKFRVSLTRGSEEGVRGETQEEVRSRPGTHDKLARLAMGGSALGVLRAMREMDDAEK
jgi:hypothetical protein